MNYKDDAVIDWIVERKEAIRSVLEKVISDTLEPPPSGYQEAAHWALIGSLADYVAKEILVISNGNTTEAEFLSFMRDSFEHEIIRFVRLRAAKGES